MAKVILTVDDSASVRQMVKFTLVDAGYTVIEAVDGQDALTKLTRPVNLVITDLNMPNLDGIGLIRRLRANPACKGIPIIMLTTESQDSRKTGRQGGRSDGLDCEAIRHPAAPGGGEASAWMIDKYKQAFQEEARELLAELESALLELDQRRDDREVVGRAFRALHTIKGIGCHVRLRRHRGLCAQSRNAFDRLRNGQLEATADLINLTLAAGDQIKNMLDAADGRATVDQGRSANILAELRQLTGSADVRPEAPVPVPSPAPDVTPGGVAPAGGPAIDWRIRSGRGSTSCCMEPTRCYCSANCGNWASYRSLSTRRRFRRSARSMRSAATWPGTWY